jgi:hypothetical protein
MYNRFIILGFACAISCQQNNPNKQLMLAQTPAHTPTDTIYCPDDNDSHSNYLIPDDLFAPKNREEMCDGWYMPEDMVTPNKNYIQYLISNDTCCREYLYLKWGNEHFQGLENLDQLRIFHPRMTPTFFSESKDYIIMLRAASGGWPIAGWDFLFFPLDSSLSYQEYFTISPDAFDQKSSTLIREVENNHTDEYLLEAFNIKTGHITPIKFKHKRIKDDLSWGIDSISITTKHIYLHLYDYEDSIGRQETIFIPNKQR